MQETSPFPPAQPCFRPHFCEPEAAAAPAADLRPWRRLASLEALAATFGDAGFNPFQFQIDR